MFKKQQENSVASVEEVGRRLEVKVAVEPYTPRFLLRNGTPSWESSAKRYSLRKVT